MTGGHQISAAVVAGPHQVTGGFLGSGGNGDRGDLPQMQQAGKMGSITSVDFDPVPRGADQL